MWEERFREAAFTSAKIFDEAREVLGGGMAHDIRFTKPFPLAIDRAEGARKWDPDGNEYVDYVIGHGALILGHAHPSLVDAVREQVARGTHYGAAHRSEVDWAELVCRLIPSAERVRFTSSGTEAVMLAVRLARAFTGRSVILKFHVHFHGWSEVGLVGLAEPFHIPATSGLPEGGAHDVVAVSPRDSSAIEERLNQGDVAAVILEPSGAHFGQLPIDQDFLRFIREVTRARDVLLIFDEVITGFRWSPGGAQERFGVLPDLTSLGKIVAGGLPGGAVTGPNDILQTLEIRGDPSWNRYSRVPHPGTFNANPLSAAAAVPALRLIAEGSVTARADGVAETLRAELQAVLERRGVPGLVYGESSVFHIYLGPEPAPEARDQALAGMLGDLGQTLRTAMLANGVDLLVSGGMVSAAHGQAEIEQTVAAFDHSIEELAAAGVLPDA